MLEGQNIVCISQTTWYGEFTKSTVQLLSLLAEKNNVIFIEYPFTWKDVIMSLLGKQKAQVLRMFGIKKRLIEITTPNGAKIKHLVVPPVFPVDFLKNDKLFDTLFQLNSFIYSSTVNRVLKKLKIKNPIVITAYNPLYGLSMIGKLEEFLNVYYCYDGMDTRRHRERIFDIEKEFCRKVDGIITTSEYLQSEKKVFNSNCFVVKNGVDYDLFSPHTKEKVSSKDSHKKIGYIGTLDQRFDIDIVEYAIQKLPHITFEFTGYLLNSKVVGELSKYENVAFFNPIKAEDVPELLCKYDLGIIPYKTDEVNKNIYPLKINEYLAVGVPVVMTNFANLKEFKDVVKVAETKEDFVAYIVSEIENDTDDQIAIRTAFAKKNSWKGRANEFADILSNFINQK